MNVLKEIGKAVGMFVCFAIVFVLSLYLTIGLGFVIGIIVISLPWLGDFLTVNLPIDKSQVPAILAWVSVITAMFATGMNRRGEQSNEESRDPYGSERQ